MVVVGHIVTLITELKINIIDLIPWKFMMMYSIYRLIQEAYENDCRAASLGLQARFPSMPRLGKLYLYILWAPTVVTLSNLLEIVFRLLSQSDCLDCSETVP